MSKPAKRNSRRLPVPVTPQLELRLDSGETLTLDRLPDHILALLVERGAMPALSRIGHGTVSHYMGHGYLVIVSTSIHPEHGPLLHVSVSHGSGQLPGWYILKAVKQAIFPKNVAAMMPLPEERAYTNLGEVLHLIQTPRDWISL